MQIVSLSRSLPTDGSSCQALTVVDLVWPQQVNHHGTLFGGAALSMLDRVAFMLGSRVLGGAVVTAAVSRLDFRAPIPGGWMVECAAHVVRKGQRSVTLALDLVAEALLLPERTLNLSGEFVMVRASIEPEAVHVASDVSCTWLTAIGGNDGKAVARVAEIVFPEHANHRGVAHGGPVMSWMAKAGFVAATRHVRRTVVMAHCSQIDFIAPLRVGDVAHALSRVVQRGDRSIEVEVELWGQDPATGHSRLCAASSMVYVAVA